MKRFYVAAVLLGAGLLFLVQPMSARTLLPLLGGAPAVWNTCLVFFQAALLLGYLYAHVMASWVPPRAQAGVHLALLAAAALFLPPALPATPPPSGRAWPVAWLLLALARSVGLPFFVLATTGPLLQRWLAGTRLAGSEDPYPLYAAGNAGSFAGLLAYPFLLERVLDLPRQRLLWSAGYLAYAGLVAACAWPLLRGAAPPQERRAPHGETVSWTRRLRWLLLAFIPASLVLGVTQYLTTDVAAVPLLWVVPLSVYLLTFVVAFSPRGRRAVSPRLAGAVLACAAVPAAVSFAIYSRPYAVAFPVFHLAALAAAGLLCHGRLAEDRPSPAHLTEFYLLLAAGGVLGGIFNALLAPVLFDSLLEYPLMLIAACAVRAALARRPSFPAAFLDLAAPAAVVLARLLGDQLMGETFSPGAAGVWLAQVAVPAAVCLVFVPRRLGFLLGFVALLALAWTQGGDRTRALHAERTFFGVTRVVERFGQPFVHPELKRTVAVNYHVLYHGNTIHGKQPVGKSGLVPLPTSYYHPTGPVGRVFVRFGGEPRMDQVALVGLGAGTLAAYGRPGQTLTFYEIDPEVLRTASDPSLFRFLADSRAKVEVRLGDGRLSLATAPDRAYGLLVLDAFSSDAIPVHLLTREAMALYRSKLREDGILAVHVTNRYLDLVPVVEALAHDAGLTGIVIQDTVDDTRQQIEGKDSSTWVLLAADAAALGTLPASAHARPLASAGADEERYLWTDSFSNLVSVFKLWR